MELHKAIYNILKYQGRDFVKERRMINALADFNAFESHRSIKNVLIILFDNDYIGRLIDNAKWDIKALTLISDAVTNFSLREDIVTYVMTSFAYALNILDDISLIPQIDNECEVEETLDAPKPSLREIEKFLKKKIVIKTGMFGALGLTINSLGIYMEDETCISIMLELTGRVHDAWNNLKINASIYSENNVLKSSGTIETLSAKQYMNQYAEPRSIKRSPISGSIPLRCEPTSVSKVIITIIGN